MDKIELLNQIISIAKPAGLKKPEISSLEDNLLDLGLDSLDTFLLTVYLGDVYGVDETKLRDLRPETITISEGATRRVLKVSRMFEFMEEHKTKEPATLEEALGNIK